VEVTWELVDWMNQRMDGGTFKTTISGQGPEAVGRISAGIMEEIVRYLCEMSVFVLKLTVRGAVEARNDYPVSVTSENTPGFSGLLSKTHDGVFAHVAVAGRREVLGTMVPSWTVTVRNAGIFYLGGVVVRALGGYATVMPGYLFLAPGEQAEFTVVGQATGVRVEALGMEPVELALPAQ